MPVIAKGNLTYTRLEIIGDVPDVDVLQVQRDMAFRDIPVESDMEHSIGFCAFDDPMSVDITKMGGFAAVRLDTLKVPGPVLKMHTAERCKVRAAENGRDKLTKREVAVVKAEVCKELRRRTLPRTTHVQVQTEDFLVRVFAVGGVAAAVVELLEKAFGYRLRVVTPATIAADILEDRLPALEPERFHLTPQ